MLHFNPILLAVMKKNLIKLYHQEYKILGSRRYESKRVVNSKVYREHSSKATVGRALKIDGLEIFIHLG